MSGFTQRVVECLAAFAIIIAMFAAILFMTGCSTSGGTTNGNATVICVICVNPLEGTAERLKDAKDNNEVDDVPQPEPVG